MMTRCLVRAVSLWLCASACAGPADAQMLDVFGTRDETPASPAAPLLADASCEPGREARPLELEDAILAAICTHPQARRAWADARAQAAALGLAKSAYLPVLNVTAGTERDTLATTYDLGAFGGGSVTQSQNASSRYAMLNLSWVLFDFGKRAAGVRQARDLLAAAEAEHAEALQTVFFNAAEAYYAARDAHASCQSARESEHIAAESLAETRARHDAGAGMLSDLLQARTAYRRAVLERVGAAGDERTALGALAVAMGRDANTPITLAERAPSLDLTQFSANVDRLIEEAKARQPRLAAARARLEAARATVDAARAQGRPTLSLVGNLSQNNPSQQQQPQSTPITRSHGSTIGIQLTIPLFDGFASGYRVAQARAQADAQEDVLRNTELDVSLEVWRSYQDLQTDADNLENSRELLSDAQRSLDVARGRYRAGVGSFTELLNAQSALADAQKQRVLAVSRWRMARLRLAASLGKLGVWNMPS